MTTYTEEEAKTKWCPHVVASHRNPRGGFMPGQKVDEGDHVCIASRCMAWRGEPEWRIRSDYPWNKGRATSTGLNVQERIVGYCGLAGRPA